MRENLKIKLRIYFYSLMPDFGVKNTPIDNIQPY